MARGKSLLELRVTTFIPDRQPPLIFVRFISNFLCSNSMASTIFFASAHVILKEIRQRLRVVVSREEKWYPTILRNVLFLAVESGTPEACWTMTEKST